MISHDRALFLITLSQVCEERAVSDSPLCLLHRDDRKMRDLLDMFHKIVVVLFPPLIAVSVNTGDLIHHKMNMGVVRVLMDGIDHLVLRCIVPDDLLRVPIRLFRRDVFLFVEAEHRVSHLFTLGLSKIHSGLLHLLCCCLRGCNIAAPNIGRFFRIKNVVRCGAVGIVIKKFSVLPDSDYFVFNVF